MRSVFDNKKTDGIFLYTNIPSELFFIKSKLVNYLPFFFLLSVMWIGSPAAVYGWMPPMMNGLT